MNRRIPNLGLLFIALLVGAAATALPATASADSPTYGFFELRGGPYYPSIDDEAGLQGDPFQTTFGGGDRLLGEVEVGYHLWDGFGALGVSGTIGYTNFTGDAEIQGDVPLPAEDGEDFSEDTNFNIVPLRATLYYRVDQFQDMWNIPLVPVLKGGADYWLWEVEDGDGDTAESGGDEGDGALWGWHAAVALQLGLDWIEPSAAASMDVTWGVNHSYLFAEYQINQIDDFGGDGFDLSDNTWMFGLAFEF